VKLPLEYNILSPLFELVGSGSKNSTNRVIGRMLKQHRVKTVLDLTCGTGSQVIWLSQHGFNVTGSDYSPKLLSKAKSKLKAKKIRAKLYQGDMRTQRLGQFDAVITIFNAVGHLTKKGFEKAMRNIHRNLKPGGIYIFDIFNLDSINEKDMSGFDTNKKATVGGMKAHIFQYSVLDKKKGLLISYDNYRIQKEGEKPKKFQVKFPLQIYSPKELNNMLSRAGFDVVGRYDMDGSRFSSKKTKEMITVARRKV
jgi:SAM-dependent methyltransferase